MIRYAITDGSRFGTDAEARFTGLMQDAARWADADVEFVQLREKDLCAKELLRTTYGILKILREHNAKTKLLVNGRADIARAVEADGVHLTSTKDELTAEQVRRIVRRDVVVSISCHTLADVEYARDSRVDLILFGPIFEKRVAGQLVRNGIGVPALKDACNVAGNLPVLALGGVDVNLLSLCSSVGAAGHAGIRIFLDGR